MRGFYVKAGGLRFCVSPLLVDIFGVFPHFREFPVQFIDRLCIINISGILVCAVISNNCLTDHYTREQ